MKVGQTVFIKTVGNAARYGGSKIIQTEISKVGTKYFEVKSLIGCKFHKDTKIQKTDYSKTYEVYNSREEIEEKEELYELRSKLGQFFSHSLGNDLTLNQYRRIDLIVSESN